MKKSMFMRGLVCFVFSFCQSQAAENQAQLTLGYPVRPIGRPVVVDGKLSPGEWDEAVQVSGFRLSGSEEFAPEQMVMRLLYDSRNLYLGVKCAESRIQHLVTTCQVDDSNVWHDDCIEFFIDANHDHASYWQFIVNSCAVGYDAAGFNRTWNCEWKKATSQDAQAWYIEVAIPFRELKVPAPSPGTVWGFNLDRERRAGGGTQLYNWADVQGNFHRPELFGHLRFVGKDWRASAEEARAAAASMGGTLAHVYMAGGYWVVPRKGAPRQWSYRELLRNQEGIVAKYLDELKDIFKQRPKGVLRPEFERLMTGYRASIKLGSGEGQADPEACAAAKVFLDGLEGKLKNLYWRARLEMLNETF